MNTPKPKRPSAIASVFAAVGVTSSDAPEQPDVAVEQPRRWPATRAEREAMRDDLVGAIQRAQTARADELREKEAALRAEWRTSDAAFTDALRCIHAECEALHDADYQRAFAAAYAEFEGLAREWVTEPNRAIAHKIATACRAHGPAIDLTLPNIGPVQHAAGALARAMHAALGATTGGGKSALAVATAAYYDEDVVVISDRLAELEREIRGAQRATRDRANDVRPRMQPHAI